MSEQHEEEILRRWAREQAEIERQTDALVLKALTAMVTAAEDLKSKLRRDVDGILEEFRRTKRGLENEVSLVTAERQRFRREAEQERDAIVAGAQAKAREIVAQAERERETLLTEVRAMEQRLRTLEEQIRSVFDIEIPAPLADADAERRADVEAALSVAEPATSRAFVPANVAALTSRSASPPQEDIEDIVAVPPSAPLASLAPAAPAARVQPSMPAAPVLTVTSFDDDDDESGGITPEPAGQAPGASPAGPTGPHPVELVFDGVPGYQQASALEMAVGDLLPDVEVDIVEFERGQLVLSAEATDLEALASQLVASMPASLQLASVAGDRATFHCV